MFDDDGRRYRPVRNGEDQYSIWPAEREIPAGWAAIGEPGTKADCLSLIRARWTDLRPDSLRRRLGERS